MVNSCAPECQWKDVEKISMILAVALSRASALEFEGTELNLLLLNTLN
jgi:hypothetical protein